MGFTHNDWGQCDIIKKNKILTNWYAYTIYTVIMMIYHKFPSNTILKHSNILDQLNKSSYKRLL